jgi:hypothetical protein
MKDQQVLIKILKLCIKDLEEDNLKALSEDWEIANDLLKEALQ